MKKVFKIFGIGTVGVFFIFILAIAGAIGWGFVKSEMETRPDPSCFSSEKILVRMGEHVFAIPRAQDEDRKFSIYLGNNGESVDKCYKIGDPPIEVDKFSFYPFWIPFNNVLAGKDNASKGVGLRVQAIYSNYEPIDGFVFITDELAKTNRKLSDFPIEKDLYNIGYLYENNKLNEPYRAGMNIFVSADKEVHSLNGNPMTFGCRKIGDKKDDITCESYFTLDKIRFYIDQTSGDFDLDEWKHVYSTIYQYLNSFEYK